MSRVNKRNRHEKHVSTAGSQEPFEELRDIDLHLDPRNNSSWAMHPAPVLSDSLGTTCQGRVAMLSVKIAPQTNLLLLLLA